MRHYLLSIISIIACFSSVKAQTLSEFTFSAFSLNTEEITATMGETNISSSINSQVLSPGFIEVLLAEAEEIPETPSEEPEPPSEEEPEIPTSVEQLENPIRIKTTRNLLQVYCSQPYLLTIFNLKGSMILKEKIELDYNKHLSTGIYILILQNEKEKKVYKINIH